MAVPVKRPLQQTETKPVSPKDDLGHPIVVQSTVDITKYGLIVLNPDGSNIT